MSKKVCTKCKQEKVYSDYCLNKGSNDGLSYRCKKCNSERNKIKYLNEKYGISERVAEQMVEGYRK